jgi:DNA-binding response OmpR family regulator
MNPSSGVLNGRRILVVEDEAMVSMMLADLLTSAGAVVIGPAGTTTGALALVEQEVIHCAVLDIKLTDGMSVPVAEALAARGIPFVIATGYRGEAIPRGYDGAPVLRKIFTSEQLIDAIVDILRP